MSLYAAPGTGRRLDVGFLLGVALLGVAAGFVGAGHASLGAALVVLGAGVCVVAARPVLCAVLALPALYGYQSVGLGGGLGLSDLLLVGAALLALPALAHSRALRSTAPLNRAFVVYLVLLVPSLLAHPSAAGITEVVHRLVIVASPVVVGAWLVHEAKVKAALRLLLLASGFFALAAIATWLTNGHQPAYPLGYHKNYVGSLLALSLLVALCAPQQVGWRTGLRVPLILLLALGTLATQSRGAVLGAALGGFVWLFAPRGAGVTGRGRVVAVVLAAGFAFYAATSVQNQLTSADVSTNSAGVRQHVEAYTRELWRTSPLVGVGIRYFNSGQYGALAQQPNNAFDNELAESGLAGTAGFVVLHGAALVLLWRRRRSPLGVAALATFTGQFLHGQFDIYWSSGLTPLPFLLAGMALAEDPSSAEDREPEPRQTLHAR